MKSLCIFILLLLSLSAFIQSPVKTDLKSAEFNANCSTAFGLLDMSPAVINSFGSYKEVKVDWFWKDNKIQDNIAVEFAPFWYLFYNKMNYSTFEKLPYLLKKVSDITFSLGNKRISTNYNFGLALNINLYKQADPICDTNLIEMTKVKRTDEEKAVMRLIMKKEMKLDFIDDPIQKLKLKEEISALEDKLDIITEKQQVANKKIIADYKKKNWNKIFVNIGVGNVFHYHLSPAYNLTPLNNTVVVWLHHGYPLGELALISILTRFYFTQLICNGVNVRFGESDVKNAFIEVLSYNNFVDRTLTHYDLNIGGVTPVKDFKISLGFKFVFDHEMQLKELVPTYNFNLGF